MALGNRPHSLQALSFISLLIFLLSPVALHARDFDVEEATVDEIEIAISEGRLTSLQLVELYLDRIAALNPVLRGVLEVNPDARQQARDADAERRRKGALGPRSLLGIPVLLKDTIATHDALNTTAGSYSLLGSVVARDAGVVERLRSAGAVILGKASLSEWYSFRSLGRIPNGWSPRAGQGVNPYIPSGDPCGSSSGSAISVAANMAAVSLGTETHGSILCPADHNSVVGFKPTVGLTSRAGVIPVAPRRDTVGVIARTVSDAVYVLDVIVGFDPRDHEATKKASSFVPIGGYKQFLNPDGLVGKKLGVVRNLFMDHLEGSVILSQFEQHLSIMRRGGARIVDNLKIKNLDKILNPKKSGELTTMLAEFKLSVNDYLKELIFSPVKSLADVIAFINDNPVLERTNEYGQGTFIASDMTNGFGEKERKAFESMKNLSRDGFEKLMIEYDLDAIVAPSTSLIPVLAIGGHPGITVPAGYETDGKPYGICFGGLEGSEPKLIEIAHAFEQATMIRKPPDAILLKLRSEIQYGGI